MYVTLKTKKNLKTFGEIQTTHLNVNTYTRPLRYTFKHFLNVSYGARCLYGCIYINKTVTAAHR